MAKAVVLFQPKIINQITYYSTSNVVFNKNIQWINTNPHTYYCTANVFLKYYDTHGDHYSVTSYPKIDFKGETYVKRKFAVKNADWNIASTYVAQEALITKTSDLWSAYATALTSYVLNFGLVSTLQFDRVNSNIYKNIFNHLIFDIYSIQDKIIGLPYKKTTEIFQMNHGFHEYDLLYLDHHGFYRKGIANSEETYSVVGIVSEVIDEHNFILMTNGIINNPYEFDSESGVLYLSDKVPGKFSIYENIDNTFYTPVGFYNNDKLIINILDSSVGDILKPYQEHFITQNFTYLTQNDINDVVQEVLMHS